MIPVMPAVEYNQIEESKEYSAIDRISLFINARKEFTALIEKQIEKINTDDCGCEDENKNSSFWNFPIICEILFAIALFGILLVLIFNIEIIGLIAFTLGELFNCSWT